ncbi:GroES-like domain-containing protein [Phanerochaete sordida]|uniref:GroES-like domain-containing protein n=1 Tax=Phanerochaete sordida TaxID=48140 RepID=A0A9P3G4Q4_9APHY|nr:GroES-like domain-containing protein [Phanerochaete sordida]
MSSFQPPKSYTAYQWEAANTPLTRTERPWKDPEHGEVVVKVLACGVCGTDGGLHTGKLGPVQFPLIPGHEVVGDVVSIHPSVEEFKVGDRVGAPWQRAYCGSCSHCKKGVLLGCDKLMMFSTGGSFDGGIAEYLRVPTSGICHLPKDIDPAEAAPLMCAGVTVFKGMENLNIKPGSTVAIQGVGGLGHLAVQYSKAMGFRTIAISTSSDKRDLSLKLGADIFIDESTQNAAEELQKLGGANVIVTTAPRAEAIIRMIGGLAFEGKLLVLSLPLDAALFQPVALPGKRLSIHGWFVGTAEDCCETVKYSARHNVKVLVEKFPMAKAEEAFQHREKAHFRAVILPWE